MKKTSKGLLLVIISGITFGLMPGAVKFCISQGATKELMAFMRCFFMILVLLPSALKNKNTFSIYRDNFFKLLLLSAAGAATPLLLYSAYAYLDTGLVTTVHFMFPAVVAVLSFFILKEKLSKRKLLCLALCIAGIVLILNVKDGEVSLKGLLIAFVSSVTWSFYIVLLKKFEIKGASSEQIAFYYAIDGTVLTALYIAFAGGLPTEITPVGVGAVALFNLLIATCGSLFFILGVRMTDAQTAAIASTLEPITSIAAGLLFLGETISVRTGIGCALILAAVILLAAGAGKEK